MPKRTNEGFLHEKDRNELRELFFASCSACLAYGLEPSTTYAEAMDKAKDAFLERLTHKVTIRTPENP